MVSQVIKECTEDVIQLRIGEDCWGSKLGNSSMTSGTGKVTLGAEKRKTNLNSEKLSSHISATIGISISF